MKKRTNGITDGLRARLVKNAQRIGLALPDAEDVAQAAIAAAVEKSPKNPAGYAVGAANNLAARWYRDVRRRTRKIDDRPPTVRVDEALNHTRELVKLCGAMEQVVMWGTLDPGGNTYMLVESVLDVDVSAILRELAYYLDVIERIPVSQKQHGRLRDRFLSEIQSALTDSGYKYRGLDTDRELPNRATTASEPAPEEAHDGSDQPPDGEAGDGSVVRTVTVINDHLVSRGVSLVHLLGVKIGHDQAIEIACAARAAMSVEQDEAERG